METNEDAERGELLKGVEVELEDAQAGDAEPAAVPPPKNLSRQTLLDEMPEDLFEQVVAVTKDMIDRRFKKVVEMSDVSSKDVNINPFLMAAMAPAYNIFSPFEAAEYAQMSKLPHGDATAFGRYVEDKIFPIFGVEKVPEKDKGSSTPADQDLFSSIDRQIEVEGVGYYMTLKSGPWTMNQSHAHEMSISFPKIHQRTGRDIIIGIYYGRRDRVNNKPGMVMSRTGPYVHTLVGGDLWEFVTGVRDAHLSIFKAIQKAQAKFALEHGGKTVYEHMIESRLALAGSFRSAFDLIGDETDMWEGIFRGSF